ncbi:hypothetical protein ACA910_005500 [Epithemia clementina (nom. ined.)]
MSELRQRRQKQQQQQQQQNNNNNHHSGTGGGGGGAAATSVAAATTQTTDIDANKRTTTTAVRDTATAFSTTTTTSSSRKSRNPNSNNSNNNNSQPPTKTNHTTALAASTTKKKGRFLTLSSLASSSAAASTTATTTTSSTRGLLGGSKKMPTTTTQSLLSLSLSSPPTAPTTTRRQSSSTTDLAQAAAALAAKPPPPPPQPLLHRESSSFVMASNSTQLSHSESSQSFWGNADPQQQQQQPQQLLLPAQPQPIPIIMTTPDQVRKKELTLRRFLLRLSIGSVLFSSFCGIVYLGHLYICLLVVLIETVLFYELVRVRYFAFYPHIKDNTIPLFRTTQWMWFFTAMIYTYGDFLSDIVQHNHEEWHQVVPYLPYFGSISLVLYSATLMVTIVTLQRDHLKFQINQLCWTVVVLCLTLGQLKYVMHNIFNGLIWFVMPVCMVIFNDVMAYACGITMGRKFITRPFLSFSPNKTWEGFVGAGVCTLVASWYFGQFLVQFSWLTCPTKEFRIVPQSLHCTPDPVFMPAQWVFPSQMFELLPQNLARTIPGMVEICSSSSTTVVNVAPMGVTMEHDGMMPPPKQHDQVLEPCISGNDRQVHHHFELRIKDNFYPIQLHAVWLALFASVVAPFGGFLASAIKRAYGLKDFAAIIPGHGGMMDRMDCQFFMALCTWVYYNSFIKIATVSVPKLTYLYSLLSEPEQGELIQWIVENSPHVAAKAVAAAAAAAAGTASSSGAESSGAEPPLSLDDRNNYYDDDTEVIWLDDKTTNGF